MLTQDPHNAEEDDGVSSEPKPGRQPLDHLPKSSERSMAGRYLAELSWANTTDRSARTAPARAARDQRFLDLADGDPVRAAHLRKAHFTKMALKSAQARRRNRQVREGGAA